MCIVYISHVCTFFDELNAATTNKLLNSLWPLCDRTCWLFTYIFGFCVVWSLFDSFAPFAFLVYSARSMCVQHKHTYTRVTMPFEQCTRFLYIWWSIGIELYIKRTATVFVRTFILLSIVRLCSMQSCVLMYCLPHCCSIMYVCRAVRMCVCSVYCIRIYFVNWIF